jgi:hypothetical protein
MLEAPAEAVGGWISCDAVATTRSSLAAEAKAGQRTPRHSLKAS